MFNFYLLNTVWKITQLSKISPAQQTPEQSQNYYTQTGLFIIKTQGMPSTALVMLLSALVTEQRQQVRES